MTHTAKQWLWLAIVLTITAICYVPPVFHILISFLPQPWGFFVFATVHSGLLIALFYLAPTIPQGEEGAKS